MSSNSKLVVVSDAVLLTQLTRDSPAIAASFDRLCGEDLRTLSQSLARCMSTYGAGFFNATDDRILASLVLLMNALSTWHSAVEVLRNGYRLQPGILLRSMVENVAVALATIIDDGAHKLHERGNLKSTRALSIAQRHLPIFGRFYGGLSELHTHVGNLHKSINPVSLYEERDEPLRYNLAALHAAILVLDITCELVCFPWVPEHRYWVATGPGAYSYDPASDEIERLNKVVDGIKKQD